MKSYNSYCVCVYVNVRGTRELDMAAAVHAERGPRVPDISHPRSTMCRVKMPRVRLQRQRELLLMNARPVAPACVSAWR